MDKECNQCHLLKHSVDDFQKQKNICKECTKHNYQKRREEELASSETKTCIHCKKEGKTSEFISLKNICKVCDKIKKQERNDKKKLIQNEKTCSQCNASKVFDDFKTGLNICKACVNKTEQERRSKWTDEKRQEERNKSREYYRKIAENPPQLEMKENEEKICTVCLETKLISEFYPHKQKGTIRSACKCCLIELKRQYYETNKEKYNKQITEYQKKKIKYDHIYHFFKQMRCRIYTALVSKKLNKDKRTLEYIGCTTDFFQKWMEFQLYDGMTLENYGKVWHVDHTKPIASFDLRQEKECHECFLWKNCRPFLALKNIKKGISYHPFDTVLQDLKAYFFLKSYQPSSPPATVK